MREEGWPGREGWYDIAQICLNGHIINAMTSTNPEHSMNFCDICGASTITNCQHCKHDIRGKYHVRGVLNSRYMTPKFCLNCGTPYSWTDIKIKAAQELVLGLDNLTQVEKENLNKSLNDIIRDTPETTVAATKAKKLFAKAGRGVAEGFKNILVDIVSEAAKKMIWP